MQTQRERRREVDSGGGQGGRSRGNGEGKRTRIGDDRVFMTMRVREIVDKRSELGKVRHGTTKEQSEATTAYS